MGFLSRSKRQDASNTAVAAPHTDKHRSSMNSSVDVEKQRYAKVRYITPRVVFMGILVSIGGLIFGMFMIFPLHLFFSILLKQP